MQIALRIYSMNGKSHSMHLENAAQKRGYIDLSGSYTGPADSVRLCTPTGEVPHSGNLQIRGQKHGRRKWSGRKIVFLTEFYAWQPLL